MARVGGSSGAACGDGLRPAAAGGGWPGCCRYRRGLPPAGRASAALSGARPAGGVLPAAAALPPPLPGPLLLAPGLLAPGGRR